MPLKLQSLITSFYVFKTMLFPQVRVICFVLPSSLSHFPDYAKKCRKLRKNSRKKFTKVVFKKINVFHCLQSKCTKSRKSPMQIELKRSSLQKSKFVECIWPGHSSSWCDTRCRLSKTLPVLSLLSHNTSGTYFFSQLAMEDRLCFSGLLPCFCKWNCEWYSIFCY